MSDHDQPVPRSQRARTASSKLDDRAEPALGRRHHRDADHERRQVLSRRDHRPLFARFVRRLGGERGQRPAPDDLRALEAAIRRRCPGAGLLHHSDQGSDVRVRGLPATCFKSQGHRVQHEPPRQLPTTTPRWRAGTRRSSSSSGRPSSRSIAAKEQLFDYIEVFYNQRRQALDLSTTSVRRAYERADTARQRISWQHKSNLSTGVDQAHDRQRLGLPFQALRAGAARA